MCVCRGGFDVCIMMRNRWMWRFEARSQGMVSMYSDVDDV